MWTITLAFVWHTAMECAFVKSLGHSDIRGSRSARCCKKPSQKPYTLRPGAKRRLAVNFQQVIQEILLHYPPLRETNAELSEQPQDAEAAVPNGSVR